jgi:hypothetical protein
LDDRCLVMGPFCGGKECEANIKKMSENVSPGNIAGNVAVHRCGAGLAGLAAVAPRAMRGLLAVGCCSGSYRPGHGCQIPVHSSDAAQRTGARHQGSGGKADPPARTCPCPACGVWSV